MIFQKLPGRRNNMQRAVFFIILFSANSFNCVCVASNSMASDLDFSYMGVLSGPSLEPSWDTPILVGESHTPSNLRSQIKAGYRVNNSWSIGPLMDFTLSIDSQYNQFHDPALAVTKYNLIQFERFSVTADFRLYFSMDKFRPSGIQSFQTTTYHFSGAPISFTMYSFIHYELNEPGLILSGFPVLAYHLSHFIHPAVFVKSTALFSQENRLLDFGMGPGVIFTPSRNLTLSIGLAMTPTNISLANTSILGFVQSNIF
jgi:hypothetical protein